MSDYNRAIIEEFRANEGRVGGNFEGRPLLLLTTTGARSCRSYTKPLVYLPDDGRLVVFASKGGAPTNPDWYHNLRAHPTATVEVGGETYDVDVAEVHGAERGRLFAGLVLDPAFVPAPNGGTNPIPSFVAIVSGFSTDLSNPVNLTTGHFPASKSGNADVSATLALPKPFLAPIIFVASLPIGNPAAPRWFAVTGVH